MVAMMNGYLFGGLFVRFDSYTSGKKKHRPRLNVRKFAFYNGVVNNWNNLPHTVVHSYTVSEFQKKLDEVYKFPIYKLEFYECIEHRHLDNNDQYERA